MNPMPSSSDLIFPMASFNQRVDKRPRSVKYEKYAEILWKYGGLLPAGKTLGDVITLATKDYSVPAYDVKEANTKVKVFQHNGYKGLFTISNTGFKAGGEVPFNLAWKPGTGNDNILHVIDWELGKVWEMGAVTYNEPWNLFDSPWGWLGRWAMGPNGKAGFEWGNPNHIGVGGIQHYSNLWTGTDINPKPSEKMILGRGCGLPGASLIVRAERVRAALKRGDQDIGHALPMSISTTMHDTDSSGPGFFVPPATRVEWGKGTAWANRCTGGVPLNKDSIPQGLTIAIEPTFDVPTHLDKMGFSGAKRATAEILLNTAKRRGIILGAETGCGASALIQTDGLINPTTAKVWAELGVVDTGGGYPSSDLLKNCLQHDPATGKLNYYVVEPPTIGT